MAKCETEAKRKLDEVKAREETLGEEVEKQLKRKVAEAEAKAAKKTKDTFSDQFKELKDSLKEKDDSLKTFRENELALRTDTSARISAGSTKNCTCAAGPKPLQIFAEEFTQPAGLRAALTLGGH